MFKENFHNEWCVIDKESYVKICKLEENQITAIPQVSYLLTILKESGKTTLQRHGEKLDMAKIAFGDFDATTQTLKNREKNVLNFIAKLKQIAIENCTIKDLLKIAQAVVHQCVEKCEEENICDEKWNQSNSTVLKFIHEQLNLILTEKRKFSPAIIRFAMMMKFYSTSGYRAVRDSKFIILPSESTLHCYIVPKRESDVNQSRFVELSRIADSLPDNQKEISIIFDEMALQPNINFDPSGHLAGFAANQTPENTQLATSMLCFMIQGLKKNFHEVVSFHPVHNLNSEYLEACLLKVIYLVKKAKFRAKLIVSDNHSINRKAYRNMSGKSDEELMLDPVIINPHDPNEKLVLSHDPVHILKCLRNNWFRKGDWKLPDHSSISWNLLKNLKEIEESMPIRKAHSLSTKALKPNNMEKQKVKLAYNVVSWPIRNALLYYSESSPELFPKTDVETTVTFMDAVRSFFDILNINHVKKGPISSTTSPKIEKLKQLQVYFARINHCGILTKETYLALQQTITASLQVITMLLNSEPAKVQVFTARFQQDPLEEHYGHQR